MEICTIFYCYKNIDLKIQLKYDGIPSPAFLQGTALINVQEKFIRSWPFLLFYIRTTMSCYLRGILKHWIACRHALLPY